MATLIGSTAYQTAGSGATTPGTAPTVTVTGANQSILVFVQQEDALTRTFSASSSLDGPLSEVGYHNPSGAQGVWLLRSATVGTHTLSVVASTTGTGFAVSAQVIQDLGTGTVTDTQPSGTSGDAHLTAATGVTTTTATFVVCVNTLSGSVTTKTPGALYTAFVGPSATGPRFAQYREFASGCTAEQGAFTTTGTNRANRGLLVGFPDAADPGTPSGAGGAFTTWFGR